MLGLYRSRIPIFYVILIVIPCVALLCYAAYRIDLLTPIQDIHGLYQSPNVGIGHYNAQFYGTEFYIEFSEANETRTLLEGTFHVISEREGVYLLENGPKADDMLVVLGHEGFYFYDTQQQTSIYLMRKA